MTTIQKTVRNNHFEANYTLTNGDIVTVTPEDVTIRDSQNFVKDHYWVKPDGSRVISIAEGVKVESYPGCME